MANYIQEVRDFTSANSTTQSIEDKIKLITRNLEEILGEKQNVSGEFNYENLYSILIERNLKIYWGTAITGRPHVAYFLPICKIADFLQAGCDVTILFADLHGFLDNVQAPWEIVIFRTKYYEFIIKSMLKSIGVSLENLHFVRGTDYQLTREYSLDVYKFCSILTEHDAKKAGAEVVKQAESPLISSLLYPALQALDEHYLDVDAQFGGIDQRKIFTFAEKYLPKLGYKQRIHFMNPMIPGLTGCKMSSSVPSSKIDLLDSPEMVSSKLSKAFAEEGIIENNGILAFTKYVLFRLIDGNFIVDRLDKFGGPLTYLSYNKLEHDYLTKSLHPQDLKLAVAKYLNIILAPIRVEFFSNDYLINLVTKAYPNNDITFCKAVTHSNIESDLSEISLIDLRVGLIQNVEAHSNAALLLILLVDVGEPEPRTVVSAIRNHYQNEELIGKKVILICNIKPTKVRGTLSQGLLLIASLVINGIENVNVLEAADNSKPGECVFISGLLPERTDALQKTIKLKIWESKLKKYLTTDEDLTVTFNSVPLTTKGGIVKVNSLPNATIS